LASSHGHNPKASAVLVCPYKSVCPFILRGNEKEFEAINRTIFAFCRIYAVVVYHIKIDICDSLSQNKFVLFDVSTRVILTERLW